MVQIPLIVSSDTRPKRLLAKSNLLLRRCRSVLRTAMDGDCPVCSGDETRRRVIARRIEEIEELLKEL